MLQHKARRTRTPLLVHILQISVRTHAQHAYGLLHDDKLDFTAIDEGRDGGREILQAVKDASVEALGYFLNPSEPFSAVAPYALRPSVRMEIA